MGAIFGLTGVVNEHSLVIFFLHGQIIREVDREFATYPSLVTTVAVGLIAPHM
jgi:hypothetical protein